MKIAKITGVVFLILILIWLILSLILSPTATVERALTIDAPVSVLFENVNTLKNWEKWSYWHRLEPSQQIVYSGPVSGTGSSYSWNGKKTKQGTITITESVPEEKIVFDLDFKSQGKGIGIWTFRQDIGGIKVTQKFQTESNFASRVFARLFMGKIIEKSFEENLKNLSEVSKKDFIPYTIDITEMDLPRMWVISKRDTTTFSKLPATKDSIFEILKTSIPDKYKMKDITYPPMIIWHMRMDLSDFIDFEPAFVVADTFKAPKGFKVRKLEGPVIVTTHVGDIKDIDKTYSAFAEWMKMQKIFPIASGWEVYTINSENEQDTSKWRTEIYFPAAPLEMIKQSE